MAQAMNVCGNITDSCHMSLIEGFSYSPLFLVGLLVNAAALRAFISRRGSWTDTDVYMLNLVMADTALILFLPFRIYDSFACLPKTLLCTFLIFIHFINMYASIFTTTVISVHRYLAIKFPLWSRSWRWKKQTAVVTCLLIWVLLVGTCVFFRKENYPERLWTCYERCKNRPLSQHFMVILVVLAYLTPLVIILFCSTQIIYVLLKDQDRSEDKKNVVGMVTANMVVFVVCYTPIHIGFVVNYLNSVRGQQWQMTRTPAHEYLLVSEWIASTNCCFDSISYYFLLKKFYS